MGYTYKKSDLSCPDGPHLLQAEVSRLHDLTLDLRYLRTAMAATELAVGYRCRPPIIGDGWDERSISP